MSKRYGRNQKRRHRELLAKTEKRLQEMTVAYDRDRHLTEYLQQQINRAERTIREMVETIESVCPNSTAIPPKTFTGSGERPSFTVACLDSPLLMSMGVNPNRPIVPEQLRYVNTYALETYVQKHKETLDTAIHLRYQAGGHSAYMISERGFRDIPIGKLVELVARELVNHLRRP